MLDQQISQSVTKSMYKQNEDAAKLQITWEVYLLGCANKDLWVLCAPIFIIVVYYKTATSYFLGGKE